MKPWSWQYTLSSQFNCSDTLLMVSSGPVTSQGMPYAGEIAIFKLKGNLPVFIQARYMYILRSHIVCIMPVTMNSDGTRLFYQQGRLLCINCFVNTV